MFRSPLLLTTFGIYLKMFIHLGNFGGVADFATCAVRSLLRHCFLGGHGDGGQLGWFVFIRIRNTKPWNHFHMCTVVLWTKIVLEFMILWSGLQR